MDKKHVEPTPDNFQSYEAAADFWDSHDTTDYLDEFRTVEVNTELRARHFEVEIDEQVAKALQPGDEMAIGTLNNILKQAGLKP